MSRSSQLLRDPVRLSGHVWHYIFYCFNIVASLRGADFSMVIVMFLYDDLTDTSQE